MNYLVTGHRGFIGTNLVKYLRSKGVGVTGLDYSDCDLCDGFPTILLDLKFDVIVHLAAETNVRESIESPVKTFLRNCQSTLNILELSKRLRSKLVFISSCGAPYSSSPYAASKMAGESLCKAYRESYEMGIVILRLPNIYGPYSDHKSSVIPNFIKSKLINSPTTIYGDGSQTRNFVHVKDICRAIFESTHDMELTTGELTSINELAEMIGCDVRYNSPIKGEVNKVTSIKNLIPQYSLSQGLNETILWFKKLIK